MIPLCESLHPNEAREPSFSRTCAFWAIRDDGGRFPPFCQGQAGAKRKLFDAPMPDLGLLTYRELSKVLHAAPLAVPRQRWPAKPKNLKLRRLATPLGIWRRLSPLSV